MLNLPVDDIFGMQVLEHQGDLRGVEAWVSVREVSEKAIEKGKKPCVRGLQSSDTPEVGEKLSSGDVLEDQVEVPVILAEAVHRDLSPFKA